MREKSLSTVVCRVVPDLKTISGWDSLGVAVCLLESLLS